MSERDSPATGVVIQVGAASEGDDAPAGTTTRPPAGTGRGDAVRRRWVLALVAVIVVGIAGAVVAAPWRDSPDVVTTSLFRRDAVAAPDAPTHQVARRWFRELPADTSLLGVAVTNDLVVAQVHDHLRGRGSPASLVVAWDRTTGERAWTRELASADPAGTTAGDGPPVVVLSEDTDPATGIVAVTDATLAALRSSGIVALDVGTGAIAWNHPIDRPGWVEVIADRGRAVVHPVDGSRPRAIIIDLHTGEVVHADDGDLTPIDGGWLRRSPRAQAGGEAEQPWDVLADDGSTLVSTTSDVPPAIVASDRGDLVVTMRDTTLVASTFAGQQVWTAQVPGSDPIPATEVDVDLAPLGDGTILVGAYRSSDNEVGRLEAYVPSLVSPDGFVEEVDSEVVTGLARETGLSPVTVAGRPLLACSRTGTVSACPDDLALVDLGGTTRAAVADAAVANVHGLVGARSRAGLATEPGLVVREDGTLRLRAWEDLDVLWEVAVDAGADHLVVVPTATGVAIAQERPQPGVTWLS